MKIQVDATVFLLLPGDSPDYVYGKVVQVREKPSGTSIYRITFAAPARVDKGDETRLYYQGDGSFWCQPSVVLVRDDPSSLHTVTFEATTKPRREEHRRANRIDAYLSGITAAVQGRPECLVINVGTKGIAIVTNERHNIGDAVQVEVRWNAESWVGRMTLRHEKEAVRESRIYGLECSPSKDGDGLREGLKRITATVTFQQGVFDEMINERTSA